MRNKIKRNYANSLNIHKNMQIINRQYAMFCVNDNANGDR